MKHLPTWMAKWKREGLEWHDRETEMFEKFSDGVSEKKVCRFVNVFSSI